MQQNIWQLLIRSICNISDREASFEKRGFQVGRPDACERLERIGQTFLYGYRLALGEENLSQLRDRLQSVESEWQGFAFEGAAMGVALSDRLTPWRGDLLPDFIAGVGNAHTYMLYVGAGWLCAQFRQQINQPPVWADPLLGWLLFDGIGFHSGYFGWQKFIEKQQRPNWLSGYARRVFDQGLGRSLWFVCGADISQVTTAIQAFDITRRSDLWSGIGLASAYAGGAKEAQLSTLLSQAQAYQPYLAQGAAFAAKTRARAGNPTSHTEAACQIYCQMTAAEAATVTDTALQYLTDCNCFPAYEYWRQNIQNLLSARIAL